MPKVSPPRSGALSLCGRNDYTGSTAVRCNQFRRTASAGCGKSFCRTSAATAIRAGDFGATSTIVRPVRIAPSKAA